MLSTEFLILLGAVVLLLAVFLFVILQKINELKKNSSTDQTLILWLQSMQQSLNQNNKNINETLTRTTANINRRLDSTIGVMAEASKEVARMNELGQSIKDLQLKMRMAYQLSTTERAEMTIRNLNKVFQYSYKKIGNRMKELLNV